MAQFGNRMFGGAVPGLLGGISDMMARYPALGGGMTRPAFNKQPSGTISAMPFDPSQAGQPTGNPQPMPPGPELLPNGGMTRPVFNKTPIDLSQAQTLPAFQQQGGPTNYPGIERPMPPMGGSVGAGMRPPSAGPIGGNMMPGGVRPGTFYRPNLMPRDPRGRMRSM